MGNIGNILVISIHFIKKPSLGYPTLFLIGVFECCFSGTSCDKNDVSSDTVDAGREIGMSRIFRKTLDRAFDNSDRTQYGIGALGKLLK